MRFFQEKIRFSETLVSAFNTQMPEGFRVKECALLPEGAPALGKDCRAAHYILWPRIGFSEATCGRFLCHMERYYGEAFLDGFFEKDEKNLSSRISAVLVNPAQNGIGGWVKALTAGGIIAGWQDMCVVRVHVLIKDYKKRQNTCE
jgi:hypothetical protein